MHKVYLDQFNDRKEIFISTLTVDREQNSLSDQDQKSLQDRVEKVEKSNEKIPKVTLYSVAEDFSKPMRTKEKFFLVEDLYAYGNYTFHVSVIEEPLIAGGREIRHWPKALRIQTGRRGLINSNSKIFWFFF